MVGCRLTGALQVAGMLLYDELAEWWPLLSAAEDYAEEAAFFGEVLTRRVTGDCRRVLELGSGGGNNASHLKRRFDLTLVDFSAGMLGVSQALNPECRHVSGDMRTVRLGATFDAVFVHDAICYLTDAGDVQRLLATASAHCRPGGAALFVPDYVRETFQEDTHQGGHDRGDRGLRYLSWTIDQDPNDATYQMEFALLLRTGDSVRHVHERHFCGLFSRAEWLEFIQAAGFDAYAEWNPTRADGCGRHEVFIGIKRSG